MRVRTIVPKGLIHWLRIVKLNHHYKGADIQSPYVDYNSIIEHNVRIAYGCTVGGVQIGCYSYIEPYSFVHSCKIGKFCSIGRNVQIGGFQHDYTKLTTNPYLYRDILKVEYDDNNTAEIIIGNDVWVGSNAIILKGKIGDGAVIGAGSVITHDIAPYSIVVGNPSRIIGYRFDNDSIQDYLKLQWWNWSKDVIKERQSIF